MLRLRVFGGLAIERNAVPVAATAELHKALALLALVASRDRGISRDQLAGYLWPESQAEHARAALSQTLYTLRKQLAEPDLFIGTRTLRLNPTSLGSDLCDFKTALERDDPEAAVELYSGPFLHGFFVSDSVELERWIESERADLARRWATAMETVARRGCERGDHTAAAHSWRRLTVTEPGNSRAAAGLMAALAATGDTAGALQVAESHETFLRSEFDAPPDPAVSALVKDIRLGRGGRAAARRVESPLRADIGHERHPPPNDTSLVVVGKVGVGGTSLPAATAVDEGLTRHELTPSGPSGRVWNGRVATLTTTIGVLIAAIAIAALLDRQRARHDAPVFSDRRIAVTAFRNETGDSALASIGRTAADWVVQGLVQTQLVEVVAPGVREANLPALADAARAPNAGLIVRGSYSRTADSLYMQAQIVDAATGRVVRAVGPVSGPNEEPLVAIERLRRRLAGALATRVDPRLSRWSDAAGQPVSFEAYRAFDEGLTAFFSARNNSSFATAGHMLVRVAALDTTFSLPLVWAFYGFLNAGDMVRCDSVLRALESRRGRLAPLDRALLDAHTALLRLDPGARYQAFRRVVAIAPNSEWVYKLADAAIEVHRVAEADSLLAALDPDGGWMRDWGMYWVLQSIAAYEEGRHEEELAIVMHASARRPEDGLDVRSAGRALAALGRKRELLTLVDEALASTPPRVGSNGLFRIISAARVHGNLDIAAAVAGRALRRPVAELDIDSALRPRFELLVLEASENWAAAVPSAKRLIRLDSLQGHHDALPYIVLLEAALLRGAPEDTAGLEAKALDEAARSTEHWPNVLRWENPITVRAELAGLHGDAQRTVAALQEAVDRDFWDLKTDWGDYERVAFDRFRRDPSFAGLLHEPTLDQRTTGVQR